MKIGGLNTFSVSDFPGKVSAVVFTQGCNFRCRFCHNGFLIPHDIPNDLLIPEKVFFKFLKRRRNQLDAVVVSGGEPTIQPDLSTFLYRIKSLGFLVKLDTNGSKPDVLKMLLKKDLVDYIAMDIKAPLDSYDYVACAYLSDIEKIPKSITIIASSGVRHEFRTTVVELYSSYFDMSQIRKLIPPGSPHRLQKFDPEHALDPTLKKMAKINTGDNLL
jgi:pyruvate formate lyase activating enzyme